MKQETNTIKDDAHSYWENKFEKFEPYIVDYCNEFDFIRSFFDKHEVKGKSVLEIGCGNGRMAVYLAKLGAIVTAIDNRFCPKVRRN